MFYLRMYMSKKKHPKKKLKTNLNLVIGSVFSKNPSSELSHKHVCSLLDIREAALRKLAFTVLEGMVDSGFLKRTSYSTYTLNTNNSIMEGRLQMTTRGAGYIVLDGPKKDDVYVHPKNINHALDGDLVSFQYLKRGKGKVEGIITEVLEREKSQFVGTVEIHDHFAFFIPDNSRVGTDIYIAKEKLNGAKNGDKVLVKILVWPKSSDSPYGEVVEVLGNNSVNDLEMISILVNQGLNYTFPEEVLEEAETIKDEITEEELKIRKDFRGVLTFTIDPVDARDFDDALSFRRLDNGNIELGVHIADVSHFVRPGSPMDKEALLRSNSVYLVDRVVPMLPEQLSNKICSLRPNEDKYTFSAVFELDEDGGIQSEWFGKTVIHSDRRFTYEEAQLIIEGENGDHKDEILLLNKLASKIRARRMKSGAMNIDSEEVRFSLDETGAPQNIYVKRSKEANKLIEEFMLLANKRVANYIGNVKKEFNIPFVYRCHDEPDAEKVAQFALFIRKFGLDLDVADYKRISKNINALLLSIKERSEFSIIQSMAIRSMAKATYETENIGHYGLAFSYYTHFTSPIRRYADLMVHRILFEELNHQKHKYGSELGDVCKRISRMERKAIDAERESTKFFQALYMIDKIGEEFEGTISGMTDYGVFIRLNDLLCEGFCSLSSIQGDRYYFDVDNYMVRGSKKGKEVNLGDPVVVSVYEVNPMKRQIELELVSFKRD